MRPVEECVAAHIAGAMPLPQDELEARLAELPARAEIVAFCRGANCVLAHDATRLLAARGRIVQSVEGMFDWRFAGLRSDGRAS